MSPGQLTASSDLEPVTNNVAQAPTKIEPSELIRHYRPTALIWWFHLIILVAIACLIVLTEYTIQKSDYQALYDLNSTTSDERILENAWLRHSHYPRSGAYRTSTVFFITPTPSTTITTIIMSPGSMPTQTVYVIIIESGYDQSTATLPGSLDTAMLTMDPSAYDHLTITTTRISLPNTPVTPAIADGTTTNDNSQTRHTTLPELSSAAFSTDKSAYDQTKTSITVLIEPESNIPAIPTPVISESTTVDAPDQTTPTIGPLDYPESGLRTMTTLVPLGFFETIPYDQTSTTIPPFFKPESSTRITITPIMLEPTEPSNAVHIITSIIRAPESDGLDMIQTLTPLADGSASGVHDAQQSNQIDTSTLSYQYAGVTDGASIISSTEYPIDSPQSSSGTFLNSDTPNYVVKTLSEEIVYMATVGGTVVTLSTQMIVATVSSELPRTSGSSDQILEAISAEIIYVASVNNNLNTLSNQAVMTSIILGCKRPVGGSLN